jgi:hypothetical protein
MVSYCRGGTCRRVWDAAGYVLRWVPAVEVGDRYGFFEVQFSLAIKRLKEDSRISIPQFGSVPTDSFYKFFAVAGVSLVVSSGFIKERNLQNLLGANREFLVVGFRQQTLQHRQTDAKARLAALPTVRSGETSRVRDSLKQIESRMQIEIEALDSAGFSVNVRSQDAAATWQRIDVVTDIAAVLGFLMALYGFSMWGWRVQRSLDFRSGADGAKAQLEKAKAEIELKQLMTPVATASSRADMAASHTSTGTSLPVGANVAESDDG